jgi:hypothetical protein
VDRLDQQAQTLEGTIRQGDTRVVQPGGVGIERNNQGPAEKQRGATSRPVTPRKKMVEPRGVELDWCSVGTTDNELLTLPSSGRGRR